MRIVVSGSHATGKSTLIGDFLGEHTGFVHWGDPFETVDHAFDIPDAASYVEQLEASARRLLASPEHTDVIAERGPLDFAAYLLALHEIGRGEHGRARMRAEQSLELVAAATERVDLLVLLPIEHHDRMQLGDDDDPVLRTAMNDVLFDLADELDIVSSTTLLAELSGDRAARLAALQAAIRAVPER